MSTLDLLVNNKKKTNQPKVLVVLHLFYRELWTEINNSLSNLRDVIDFDLTITWDYSDAELENRILRDFPRAKFREFPNKGMDIGPFLVLLGELADEDWGGYDLILKLHTKRGRGSVGADWRMRSFRALAGFRESVKQALWLLSNDDVGMVGTKEFMSDFVATNRDQLLLLKDRFGVEYGHYFPAGTVFWIKTEILAKYLTREKLLETYEEMPTGYVTDEEDGSVVHAFERFFGYMVEDAGYRIVGV